MQLQGNIAKRPCPASASLCFVACSRSQKQNAPWACFVFARCVVPSGSGRKFIGNARKTRANGDLA